MPKKEKTIEICRSFSQKVSNPKNRFENMDFFASAKAEVAEKDKEKVSEELYAFVQDEVAKSVYAYKLENLPVEQPQKLTKEDFVVAKELAPKSEAEEKMAETLEEGKIEENENIKQQEAEAEYLSQPPEIPTIEE